jgi:hypothetical protein
LARVRLANQLLAALTPGKAARGTGTGEGKRKGKKKRERNKYEPCLAPRRWEREKMKRRARQGGRAESRAGLLVHPSAGLQFFQLKLFILAPGYWLQIRLLHFCRAGRRGAIRAAPCP